MISDVDDLGFTNSELVVGDVGGIEFPGAVGTDGETWDCGDRIAINGSGVEFVCQGSIESFTCTDFYVSRCQLALNAVGAFGRILIGRERRLGGVVDRNDIEADSVGDRTPVAISDQIVKTSDTVEVVVG